MYVLYVLYVGTTSPGRISHAGYSATKEDGERERDDSNILLFYRSRIVVSSKSERDSVCV